jgi:hypothetical protein
MVFEFHWAGPGEMVFEFHWAGPGEMVFEFHRAGRLHPREIGFAPMK